MSPNIIIEESTAESASEVLHNLLTSDPLLCEMEMTRGETVTCEGSRSYAAALLAISDANNSSSSGVCHGHSEVLADVSSKLHVVNNAIDSLVQGHSQELAEGIVRNATTGANASSTSLDERCNRLRRQGDLVGSIAQRVESSLIHRGLEPMERCTRKLGRLLELNRVLKTCMKLKFEMTKIRQSNHLWKDVHGNSTSSSSLMMVDLRDLVRVSSSVAVVEELLKELNQVDASSSDGGPSKASHSHSEQKQRLSIVSRLEPEAQLASKAIRTASEDLLNRTLNKKEVSSDADYFNILGATFQVYFNLGELGKACWEAAEKALGAAEKASSQLLNPGNMKRLKSVVGAKTKETVLNEKRIEAAVIWADGMKHAASQVLKIQLVLARKIDPASRQRFIDVVSACSPTEKFLQATTQLKNANASSFSLYDYFWMQYSLILGARVQRLLKYESGVLSEDVAALYPMMRSAAFTLLGQLSDTMQSASAVYSSDPSTIMAGDVKASRGILGGSDFNANKNLDWGNSVNRAADLESTLLQSINMWTSKKFSSKSSTKTTTSKLTMKLIVLKKEWDILQGESNSGFSPLRSAFIESSCRRLCKNLSNLFVENVSVDDNGVTMVSPLPILPSSNDIELLEKSILNEFNLIDPNSRDDFDMVEMICKNVVSMVQKFCSKARAASSIGAKSLDFEIVGDEHYLRSDGSAKDNLAHDLKFVDVMVYVSRCIQGIASSTCPSHVPFYEEYCKCCYRAMTPAVAEIDSVVDSSVLSLLSVTLNKKIAQCLSKMHLGAYVEKCETESFVQEHLSILLDKISVDFLSSLPMEYAPVLAKNIAQFCIYSFTSNMALIRPLGENGKLRVTQDLADIELCLEQFVMNSGSKESLSQINDGKPYAELRAARRMLFWNGLDGRNTTANDIYKGLIKEVWLTSVRPSTITNFLFSFAPSLLSSPHEFKSITIQDYLLQNLVSLHGKATEEGETDNWMTIMACCDAFQQREGIILNGNESIEGDRRVVEVIMLVGQELMRRRKL